MMELECACLCRRVHGPASPPTSFALNLVKLSSWMTEAVHCAFEDCSTLSICINHVLTQPLPVPSSFRRYWKAHSLPILHVLRHTHVARLVGDHCHQQVYLEHSLLFSLLSCTRDRILLKLVFLCFFSKFCKLWCFTKFGSLPRSIAVVKSTKSAKLGQMDRTDRTADAHEKDLSSCN